MTRISTNGIELNVEIHGSGPPLLLLHGFTGSSSTWEAFWPLWDEFTMVAVDIIGHGKSQSPADSGRFTIDACLDDLVALLDYLGIKRCALLGYSMGGRIALRFALRHPQRLGNLILESASPGIDDSAVRTERVKSDHALAARIESEGLEAFINFWQQIPMWSSQTSLSAETRQRLREQRLANNPIGLANSLRGMGAGADAPVMSQVGSVALNTLLIAGSLDSRYAEIAAKMAAEMPRSDLNVVEEAGHAVHLEKPDQFATAVSDFLHRHSSVSTKEDLNQP